MKAAFFALLLCVAAVPFVAAQSSDAELARRLGADERGMKTYVLCILKTGPSDAAIQGEERKQIFAGHFANIKQLADEGKLAVAGPFGRNDKAWRGLYVFNVATVEEAEKLVLLDPAVKAGVFVAELTPWYGSAALMLVNETHSKIVPQTAAGDLRGAWRHVRDDGAAGTWIVTDTHFAIAWYRSNPPKFLSTEGGSWSKSAGGAIRLSYEFDTADPGRIGTSREITTSLSGQELTAGGIRWTRIDDGSPGALPGAWLITGRKVNDEMTTMRPGARRTMKILSGTRFQWIAYNVETKEFAGTGGGTYTTNGGKYVENIEFFSRDDKRAGQSLLFDYDLVDGGWHHSGKSSSGAPIHEIWTRRGELGL